ncbi:MAG: NAD-dependent epimerase/dehydratase family protein [Candidatus Omnitrophota bacterium]
MHKKNILITGATGFIGSNLVKVLARDDQYNIIAIVRPESNRNKIENLKKLNVRLAPGNFYDNDFLRNLFKSLSIDCIIHCAALTGAGLGSEQEYKKINVLGTEFLLKNAFEHKVKKFIFCSSVGVWGTIPKQVPATLQTPLNPDGYYHQSKANAEGKVLEYAAKGLNAFIVRPTIVYGPQDKGFAEKLAKMVEQKKLFFKKNVRIHLVNIDKLIEIFCQIINLDINAKKIFIAVDKTGVGLEEIVNLLSMYYHGKNYPEYFMLPGWVFKFIKLCFQLMKNDKWLTRIRLLSEDWFYDNSDAEEILNVTPVLTKDYFLRQVLNIP